MKLFGLECDIKGKEHLKSEEAYILVANHQSSVDCFGKDLIKKPVFSASCKQVHVTNTPLHPTFI